ncbi:MAG: helix-turn-helix domain-containing protein [Candidatus Krumholzibacteriia bacterium]
MGPRPANIDISGGDFPSRLTELRERARLTKAELAAKGGLSYRTVHDLELGRRERIQEKTLILLADSLGVTPLELLTGSAPPGEVRPEATVPMTAVSGPRALPQGAEGQNSAPVEPRPGWNGSPASELRGSEPGESGSRRNGAGTSAAGTSAAGASEASRLGLPERSSIARARLWPLAMMIGALLLLFGGGALVWTVGVTKADCRLDGGVLVARHGVLGIEIWRWRGPELVRSCHIAPWSDRVLLAGLVMGVESRLVALDRASGALLWSVDPDVDELIAAFGAETVTAGTMNYASHRACDLDGDGEREIIVRFTHSVYYPSVLLWVAPTGAVLGQYANKGHFLDLLVADLDGDGRDEVLATGTNNTPAYQGATVVLLDGDHFRGASTDAAATPGSTVPDSAAVRLVLPHLGEPYMGLLAANRLHAYRPQARRDSNGAVHYCFEINGGNVPIGHLLVFTNGSLTPTTADITDGFLAYILSAWPDSLHDTGPADPGWRQAWLDRHLRFEAGHWPPGASLASAQAGSTGSTEPSGSSRSIR